jgi:hypothetical protein
MDNAQPAVAGSGASPCWADREEAIRRIVVERDELFALLTRICRETVCLQAPSNATNNEPSKQRIYCFAADPYIHGKIQSLCLHDALRMLPVPTPLPPNAQADRAGGKDHENGK